MELSSGEVLRGKFRDVSMENLQRYKDLPIWGKEESVGTYEYPIKTLSTKLLKIVSSKIANIKPPEQTVWTGPFLTSTSPESHIGPFKTALDFLTPDGTKVVAASDGVIIELREDSVRHGNGIEYRDFLNYLTIKHSNGEYSQYCHIGKNSTKRLGLHIGSTVERGQKIAITGMNGWTDRPHLHFIVFRKNNGETENPFSFIGLKPKFEK